MKKTLLVFALIFTVIVQLSCTKDEVIANVTADSISGIYQVTYFSANKDSYDMPYTAQGVNLTGVVRFSSSNNQNFGTYRIMIFVNGATQLDYSLELEMRDITTNSCNFFLKNVRVGKYYKSPTNEVIEFNLIDDKGNRFIFLSKK